MQIELLTWRNTELLIRKSFVVSHCRTLLEACEYDCLEVEDRKDWPFLSVQFPPSDLVIGYVIIDF
jgi:hypothetical protein